MNLRNFLLALRGFIDQFLTKVEEEPIEIQIADTIKPVSSYSRIAIIVGHTNNARGANTYPIEGRVYSEYSWNKATAANIKEELHALDSTKACKVFLRDDIGLEGACKEAAKWGADVIIELHLNSIGKNIAYGSEILTLKGHSLSAKVAKELLHRICTKFDSRNRGVKMKAYKERGYWNCSTHIKVGKAKISMLLEPCFVGVRTPEAARFLEGMGPQEYEQLIAKFLAEL